MTTYVYVSENKMITSKKRKKLSVKINHDVNFNYLISTNNCEFVNSPSECQKQNVTPEITGK